MELCYEGALAMPSSYAVMSNEEMTYTDGGGTFRVQVGEKSFVMTALGAVGGTLTTAKVTAVLAGVGASIATAIELGTAGTGTLIAGAFILAWGELHQPWLGWQLTME